MIIKLLPKHYFIVLSLAFIIALVLPYEITMAPERNIKVVDHNHNVLSNILVRQVWYQYAIDIKGEEDFITNAKGYVSLPKRSIKTNLWSLIVGGISNFSELSIHASFSSEENIGFFGKGFKNYWHYSDEGTIENGMVIMESK